jgi:hypothetical protein
MYSLKIAPNTSKRMENEHIKNTIDVCTVVDNVSIHTIYVY